MSIPFTQYLRPDGRKHQVAIDLTAHVSNGAEVEAKAMLLISKGYKFECEVLSDGVVSLTVASPVEDEGDIAIKLSRNGPEMIRNVAALVEEVFDKVQP